ncbi:hypothetical protein P4O66_003140 [Electrophorus voltai]|uniref:Uncharacterized protein n=1 Tax=Electrophorus voltai TaxID=2609070 RepID=A0AAD8YTL1_9TELE|nr:hypothetical protein P4O66_003140 [Electrophorus voltai]
MSLHRQKPPEKGTKTTDIVSETDRDKHILLQMLDLHRQKVSPIDLTSMLYISCPWLEISCEPNRAVKCLPQSSLAISPSVTQLLL